MNPFIARFAVRDSEDRSAPMMGLTYDVHLEGTILEPGGELVAGICHRLPQLMGSHFTKADGDPTLDEPTGR